ncbi:MAG: hypothetical protein OEV62_08560, partial [Actinomycetota bacterium]|nr:hypothetical protein [Actinomycetota bacterium]
MSRPGAVSPAATLTAPVAPWPASTRPPSTPATLSQDPRAGAHPRLVLFLVWLGAAFSVWLW